MSATVAHSAHPHHHSDHDHHHHDHHHAPELPEPSQPIAFIDQVPLPGALLLERLDLLRRGRQATMLPVAGSAEARQLRRWITQVLVVEALCSGFHATSEREEEPSTELDPGTAIALGSIVAAALQNCAAVRHAFRDVTEIVTAPTATARLTVEAGGSRKLLLRHALTSSAAKAQELLRSQAALPSMGWVRPVELPEPLPSLLAGADLGELLGPVPSSLGFHVLQIVETAEDDEPRVPDNNDLSFERVRVFLDWLAVQRRSRVREVVGYEHPGDPNQPDNHHQH